MGERLADYVVLLAKHNPNALQQLIDYTYGLWGAQSFMVVSVVKSECMIFGDLPNPLPQFYVGSKQIKTVDNFKYIGITFKSTHRNIFAQHYIDKASKARIFVAESLISAFPIQEGLQLYMSRVDPHLIAGCEVIIDVDNAFLDLLEAVQVMFLRRLLGLQGRSSRAVLFTETGTMPIRYRRIILALRYLIYLLGLDNNHYVRRAFNDSVALWLQGHPSWIGDIQYILQKLPVAIQLNMEHIADPEDVLDLIKLVEKTCAFMDMEVEDFMCLIIRRSDELPILALLKLAFKVLNHFDSHKIYIAPREAL